MKKLLLLSFAATMATCAQAEIVGIHPFSADKPVRADNTRLRYFFEIPKGVPATSDATLGLDYESASNLSSVDGAISILINGQPASTRPIYDPKAKLVHWVVNLPQQYLKEGFNELLIATQTHNTEGPCREDDDLRNWVRFLKSTKLTLNLASYPAYPLYSYPYPYVNWLSQTCTSVPIVTNPNASERTLSGVLNLASGLGRRLPDKPLEVRATHKPVPGMNIYLGLQSEQNNPQITTELQAMNSGLWISGKTDDRLAMAIKSIRDSEISAQMRGTSTSAANIQPVKQPATTRIGTALFSELGYPTINLNGLGSQSALLVLHRPLLIPLGRGGELHLKFRHASTLMKARSILTVTVNDTAIGSVTLQPENANDGELVCPLPIEIIDSNEWRIQITAHNELPNVDCSKSYNDVAWTTILGSSTFQLKEGSLPNNPYLEGFPYLRGKDGYLPESAIMNLGKSPSDEILTLGATTAAHASQTNRGMVNWTATLGSITGNEDVVFGFLNDEERFQPISSKLYVTPSKSGTPGITKNVPILPSVLSDAVVVQAIAKPSGGTCYVVMAASPAAAQRFADYLSSINGFNTLQGQVAVLSKDGEIYTFNTLSQNDRLIAEDNELSRYKPTMNIVMTIVGVVVLLIAIFIGRKFVKKREPKA